MQQIVTQTARKLGVRPESVPNGATATSDIRPSAVYGLGLVAAIPEADILRNEDPTDADGDGISGRPNMDANGRAGRFGRKAQHATLYGFVEEAVRSEMGITTPSHPGEELPNGASLPELADPAPDPEIEESALALLVDYLRFLAPTQRLWPAEADARSDVDEGERIFEFMGCTDCHIPFFTTGRSESPALDGKRLRLYSDLLLHDMGPELADVCTPGTTPSEWKTARLVGLGHRHAFLHDGRAKSIAAAILLHGGEAETSRDVFLRLTSEARTQVLDFLRSL